MRNRAVAAPAPLGYPGAMAERMNRGAFLKRLLFVDTVREVSRAGTRRPGEVHRFLRPPGALLEPAFLKVCTRCPLCREACPERIIVPASEPLEAPGSPVVDLSAGSCTACMKCVEACPVGALLPNEELRMGTAAVHAETCLSSISLQCRACLDACPFGERAIRAVPTGGIEVLAETCTGCGFCFTACPTDPKSIVIRGRSAVPLRGHPHPPQSPAG